ncbi:MAG: uracil-DNA glycosylase family protein [Bacteroidales bacterium]|nr:uracil-DNA glycosylase family protein [Bacteroidales bacterium]
MKEFSKIKVNVAEEIPVETHPWPPYMPERAKWLIMGTFPPQQKRWSMDFFYPNPTNDFWRIMGLIFMGDKDALYLPQQRKFDLAKIKSLLNDHGIAMGDTGYRIRRLAGNASDKFLEIIEPVHLDEILRKAPTLRHLVTTGEKAATQLAEITGTPVPKTGEWIQWTAPDGREMRIWRMPSSSRAYPMALEKKAEAYRRLFL